MHVLNENHLLVGSIQFMNFQGKLQTMKDMSETQH